MRLRAVLHIVDSENPAECGIGCAGILRQSKARRGKIIRKKHPESFRVIALPEGADVDGLQRGVSRR